MDTRRFLSLLLAIALVVSMCPVRAFAAGEDTAVVSDETVTDTAAETVSGTCGENVTWSFDEATGTLTISGTGATWDYTGGSAMPWVSYRYDVEHVVVEEGITHIGNFLLANHTNVRSVSLPSTLTSIGMQAFLCCSSLEAVTLPQGLTTLGASAFSYCDALESVTIPSTVTVLEGFEFSDCDSLRSVVIEDGVTQISDSMFKNCSSLIDVTLPASVMTIQGTAFYNCTSLKSITLHEGLETLMSQAFHNTGLESITLPASLTELNGFPFDGCNALTAIHVAEGSETYSSVDGVVYDVSGTTLMMAPSGLTAFTVPETVTSLGYYAFYGCDLLQSVVFTGDAPIDACVFRNSVTIYYPGDNETWTDEEKAGFRGTITWVAVSDNFGTCGDNAYWSFDEATGTLTISGTGAIYDYEAGAAPWYALNEQIVSVSVQDGITAIGACAFNGLTNLTTVTLGGSVTVIGAAAFGLNGEYYCYSSQDDQYALQDYSTDADGSTTAWLSAAGDAVQTQYPGFSYDYSSNTVTLTDVELESLELLNSASDVMYLELVGENTISNAAGSALVICEGVSVTVCGSGDLNLPVTNGDYTNAIEVRSDAALTVTDGYITVTAPATEGEQGESTTHVSGIYVAPGGSLSVLGGIVDMTYAALYVEGTATIGGDALIDVSIPHGNNPITVTETGALYMNYGTVTASTEGWSSPVWVLGTYEQNGGTLMANGTDCTYGFNADNGATVTLNNGTLMATGLVAYIQFSGCSLTVNGGTLHATASNCGLMIYGTMDVNGGTVMAEVGTTGTGILLGDGSEDGSGSLNMTGGTISVEAPATEGEQEESTTVANGIEVSASGTASISGGSVDLTFASLYIEGAVTVSGNANGAANIYADIPHGNNPITVTETGTLYLNAGGITAGTEGWSSPVWVLGTYVQNGGVMNANGTSNTFGFNVDGDGTVTLNAGTLNATGQIAYIQYEGCSLTVNGGTLNATSESLYGMLAYGTMTVNGGFINAYGASEAINVLSSVNTAPLTLAEGIHAVSGTTGAELEPIEVVSDADNGDGTYTTYYQVWFEEDNILGWIDGAATETYDPATSVTISTKAGTHPWSVENGVLTIHSSYIAVDYSPFDGTSFAPWYALKDEITSIVVEEGVTAIGFGAFTWLENVTTVSYPSTLESLGAGNSAGCLAITEYIIAEGNAWYYTHDGAIINAVTGELFVVPAAKTGTFTVPEGVVRIGGCAFEECTGITAVIIPESVAQIGVAAFYNCDSLTSITIPASVTTIEESAFADCSNLAQITFLGVAPTFGADIFSGVNAEVLYTADSSWTEEVMQQYGGTITWVAVSNIPVLELDVAQDVTYAENNVFCTYRFTPAEDGCFEIFVDADINVWVDIYPLDYSTYHGCRIAGGSGDSLKVTLEGGVTYEIGTGIESGAPAEGTIWISAAEHYVTGLEITSLPHRQPYVKGFAQEALDLSGLEMTVTWADGTTTSYVYDSHYYTIGDYGLRVEVDEETGLVTLGCCLVSTSFSVELSENRVAKLELVNADELPGLLENAYMSRGDYYTHVITRKAQLRVTYTDGTTEVLRVGDEVDGYPIRSAERVEGPGGINSLMFILLGATDTYDAVFVENPVASIELVSDPDPLIYGVDPAVSKNEEGKLVFSNEWGYCFEGLTFRINYTDGTSEVVSFADLTWPAAGEDFYSLPEYKNYPVEAMLYLPALGADWVYWVGSAVAENGEVAMRLHYMGSIVEFTLTLQESGPVTDLNGWVQVDGVWYYYQDGAPVTGWLKDGGYWYYLDSTGAMTTGWVKVGSNWFYMNKSGVMQTGWQKINGYWYYFASGGAMQTGWVSVGGKWYYMASGGAMQTGWVSVGGKWYYMDSSGAMQTGWITVGNYRYYLDSKGVMQTGWIQLDGTWYYLTSSGAMATGWTHDGSYWYYMDEDGIMQTGWITVNGKWYYLNKSGVMQTGWLKDGGYWYYLDSDGVMLTGTQVIDGKTYTFNKSGVWIG